MRIAVCFSGQLRTGVSASPNVLKFIGEALPYTDFFMHTWDSNNSKCLGHNCDYPHQTTPVTDFHKFNDIYKLKQFKIENTNKIFEMFKSTYLNFKGSANTWFPHYYSWQQSILYKQQYELASNFVYDIVIKMRPDCIFSERITLNDIIPCIKQNMFAINNIINPLGERAADDIYYMAKSDTMDKISQWNNYALMEWRLPDRVPMKLDAHRNMYDFIMWSGCSPNDLNLGGTGKNLAIYRHEATELDPVTQFDKCRELDTIIYSSTTQITDRSQIEYLTEDEVVYFRNKYSREHNHLPIGLQ
jgi:hypothetical protein